MTIETFNSSSLRHLELATRPGEDLRFMADRKRRLAREELYRFVSIE
ncbi:MAG TPA: hypothetical protein PKJ51_02685 [Methanothrix sp.]|nr:hypothetical protein [Methanothrix sp.]